jgi:hypothetical protein
LTVESERREACSDWSNLSDKVGVCDSGKAEIFDQLAAAGETKGFDRRDDVPLPLPP